MNEQQIREIAKKAFKARFADIEILSINVKPGFDYHGDPLMDVKIIYDGPVEQLLGGKGILHTLVEIVEKVWDEPEDDPIWPQVHFIAKSDIGRLDPATI